MPSTDRPRPSGLRPRWLEACDVAILIPCLDEEATIASVIEAFRESIPWARIVVGDNGSSDRTAARARAAGATVLVEPRRGKGNVMRRLLRDVDADAYLMVDGDATYDPTIAGLLLRTLIDRSADVVLASRRHSEPRAYRPGHRLYNRGLRLALELLFRARIEDPLTGYRCLSRRFAKTFPATSDGFEVETEMNLFLVESRLAYAEVPSHYAARPLGSRSKLSSFRDGARIALFFARNLARRRAWLLLAPLAVLLTAWISISARLDVGSTPALAVTAVLCAVAAGFSWSYAHLTRSEIRARIQSHPPLPARETFERRLKERGDAPKSTSAADDRRA